MVWLYIFWLAPWPSPHALQLLQSYSLFFTLWTHVENGWGDWSKAKFEKVLNIWANPHWKKKVEPKWPHSGAVGANHVFRLRPGYWIRTQGGAILAPVFFLVQQTNAYKAHLTNCTVSVKRNNNLTIYLKKRLLKMGDYKVRKSDCVWITFLQFGRKKYSAT